jgi:predicted  nucleic acid-binding Zn-ribbon protein
MIDESRTLEIYGYTSDTLSYGSRKPVVAVCEDCGKYRDVRFQQYKDSCKQCSANTIEYRKAMSNAHRGRHPSDETRRKMAESHTGKTHTEETKRKMSESAKGKVRSREHVMNLAEARKGHRHTEESKRKIREGVKKRFRDDPTIVEKLSCKMTGENNPFYGKKHTEETRQKISANCQGISYDEWESYVRNSPYCPKFDNACRESNREKYGRRCFICGLPESDNITSTGKHHKLSVHHVDMDKNQGCDGVRWKLVPVCMEHHHHNDLWAARFIYLLDNVW